MHQVLRALVGDAERTAPVGAVVPGVNERKADGEADENDERRAQGEGYTTDGSFAYSPSLPAFAAVFSSDAPNAGAVPEPFMIRAASAARRGGDQPPEGPGHVALEHPAVVGVDAGDGKRPDLLKGPIGL